MKREVKQIKLSELHPYEQNAKKHTEKQVKQVAASIKRFGFNQPLVVDKNNEIVVGHGRYLAAQTLGLQEAPCIKIEDLTQEEVEAYRLADNKLNESDWDMGLVIEQLKYLDAQGFDIELTGFDKDLLIEPDAQDDIIPDNAPTICKLGDIWQLGRHRLMCGDSTQNSTVLSLMGDKKADMVFTDPPYGVSYQEKAEKILGRKDRAVIANDGLGKDALKKIVFPAFQNIAESLKSGGCYYVCSPQGGELGLMMMMMMMMDAGIEARHMIVWAKDRAVFSMGRLDYDYQHEPILYGWRGSHKHIGNGQFKTSVWSIPKPRASKLHPTMKPVEVMQNAILNSSKEEDIVLDLFGGSGSTLIACEKTNRICYMMELDEKYCDVIIKRWEDYTGSKAEKIV